MSVDGLKQEMKTGVIFWGYEEGKELQGVMGIQDVQDVTLIRHAYVLTNRQNKGIGGTLLSELRKKTSKPILIGTWTAAFWAIRFYEKYGFRLLSNKETCRLLRKYWSISERQVETSVVLRQIMDKYADFAELEQNERKGEDYAILYRKSDSKIAIMAPHGGGIEPGTIEIADAIAGNEHTFYAFKGIKKSGNKVLHITSSMYDEPTGLKTSKNAFIVISIHGCRDKKEMIFIGGKNQELKQELMYALRAVGFMAVISEEPGLRGISPENICNRCKSGEGVQIEVSRGLREKMIGNLGRRSLRKKTECFHNFVNTIRDAILFVSAKT